jgi:hypothetical protein
MIRIKNRTWATALAFVVMSLSLAFAGDRIVRYTSGGAQIFDLRSDGLVMSIATKRGDNSTVTSITLPTTTTASNYAQWIPVYNVGTAAAVAGDVLCSSNTGTGYVQVCPATTGATNVVGVAAAAIATVTKGWMVPRGGGYAVVHTTGTVNIGDLLVSTSSASGYATGNTAPTSGTDFGTAMSAGTAAGGSVVAILH